MNLLNYSMRSAWNALSIDLYFENYHFSLADILIFLLVIILVIDIVFAIVNQNK